MTILKRTERSRNLILDAAGEAFRELGFANTSMEEIATRAGLTRKTVYNLFSSKEEIALRLLGRAIAHAGDEGPVELGKLEALQAALSASGPIRRTLAGALVTRRANVLTVERAPPRRGASARRISALTKGQTDPAGEAVLD